jgi:2-polyprenyl-3-methyl-5-hydroxy-6-metoxy-1,4-benzoquinol methylase
MIKQRLRDGAVRVANRARKLLSMVTPYEPMGQGKKLLDTQYASAEWDYLRSIGEAPRFGVVSAYCRQLGSDGSLLEVGCGEGFLLEQLDRSRYAHFTGVDISAVAIDRARKLEDQRTTFVCSDAEGYVPDRNFDLIVFNEVLEYFDDPLALVQRYDPFLAEQGHVIVSMFAGIETTRTRRIWKRLAGVYDVVAYSKVSTHPDYLWNIKVLRPRAA